MSSPIPPVAATRTGKPTRYLDPTAAYDLWSAVYDTDGNILQALDTIEMRSLLPDLLSRLPHHQAWKIVDLGCGTGRNSVQLLEVPEATIICLDASPKMLEIAIKRLAERMTALDCASTKAKAFQAIVYDMLSSSPLPPSALDADALISTLVLEHIPLVEFFRTLSQILKPGGFALVTNMHSEMGAISQAGFVDPETGEKVRPKSYGHRLEDVIAEAERQEFQVVGAVDERVMDEEMAERLGERAKKWIGVTVWFGVCFRKVFSIIT
ncbi:hypothetical protein JMJ35_003041 [Cladonia borealis]|uniref:Methyltransferase domain-containing protein n=1 Tax=Cladonia borealis TaxID=184061 RepID=A0AA39V6L1_9LECA|nr:hypothetical protein JMJ35_003041 [Cladonia borealis]